MNTKGTANVSPEDRKKLAGIIEHYRKQPHPFRACVKDNRKRFGPGAEAICATIKDLIEGNTWWRVGRQRGEPEGYSPKSLDSLPDDLPPEFLEWLSETSLEDITSFTRSMQGEVITEGKSDPYPFSTDIEEILTDGQYPFSDEVSNILGRRRNA